MMARWIAAALILICAADARAVSVDDLPAGDSYTIRRIDIEGAHGVSAGAIRGIMLTRLAPWYAPWRRWLQRPVFNPNLFRADLQRIAALLRESGYYQATVTNEIAVHGDEVAITIVVDEGPLVKTSSIDLEVVDFAPTPAEDAEMRAQITLAAGAPFTQAAYDASRDKLELWLKTQSYAYATVEKSAVVDTATDGAAVRYRITRGIPAAFGIAYVQGTEQVAVRLVRREIAFRQGDAFDPRKLDETQARIFGLRLFRSVLVRPHDAGDRSGTVDVDVVVVEGPSRELIAGIGYGLEDEVRGQLRWQHNDFFGGGRQFGVRLKGSAIEQAIEGEFRQPYFLSPDQTFIAPLTQIREEEPAFTVTRIRFAPRIERKLRPDLRVALGYDVEYDDLSSVPDATVDRLAGGQAGYQPHGIVSSLTAFVERRTTTDLLDPRDGSVLTLTLEQAGGPLQGAYSFYSAVVEGKKYFPLPGERTFATRLRFGTADAFGESDDVPLFRRFYAGGINSTRGYDRQMLGPLSEKDDPVGGRSLLEGSVELRTPVYGAFGGVVFFDVGEVRRQPGSLTVGDLQFGAGVGVRYRTIVGPLRLDLGFPFDPPRGEPSWQVHFSIGQAF